MSRWVRFFLVLIRGFAIGLLYGWIIDPVEYVDTFPETLRKDYRADYVLMVAEVYQVERDIDYAVEQLSFLGFVPPDKLVEEAMFFAVQSGYTPQDLGLLRNLADALARGALPVEDNLDGASSP
jgi:hypothetical protein